MGDISDTGPKRTSRYNPPHLRQRNDNKASNFGRFGKNNQTRASSTAMAGQNGSSASVDLSLGVSKEQLEKRRQKFANDSGASREYGLISRGEDNRLQRDLNARKQFFKNIQQEFVEQFNEADEDQMTASMSRLSLKSTYNNQAFQHTLMQLRKLREALLKFPIDDFAKSVFLFSVRISSRIGHYQTYIPSITHLLANSDELTQREIDEIASLYVLHLTHFNLDDKLAVENYFKYMPNNIRTRQVCESWRRLDYVKWFALFNSERDASRRKIMTFGEDKMIHHAIRCIQKSYHQLPTSYIEKIFHRDVEDLIRNYGCSWTVNDSTAVIKPKK